MIDSRRTSVEIDKGEHEAQVVMMIPDRIPIELAAKVFCCTEQHFRNLHKRNGNILLTDGEIGKRGKTYVDKQAYYGIMQPLTA
jgi:hypothetical protein